MIISTKAMQYLKGTPAGTWGILPEEGIRWFHAQRTPMCAEEIVVDFGKEGMVIGKTKKGWTRAIMTGLDGYVLDSLKSRCPDKVSGVR